jgi:hypothetical protein
MNLSLENDDSAEKALFELARLIAARMLRGNSIIDGGTHLEFHGSAEDFRERIYAALGESIADMPRDRLFGILIGKARAERRLTGEAVLIDDELPPGFASN